MNDPKLTSRIETKILTIINAQEDKSQMTASKIDARPYLQLADLYHFEKDFHSEALILERFVQLEAATNHDLVAIYQRIERAKELSQLSEKKPRINASLELMPQDGDKAAFPVKSAENVVSITRANKKPSVKSANEMPRVKGLAVCAAYTGRTEQDEVVQLALVLFEYDDNKGGKVLETYVGSRNPLVEISPAKANQFGLSKAEIKKNPLDLDKAVAMFEQADFVVSHNDADIERMLIASLIPQVANKFWYSSQKNIPWGALGYSTRSLTALTLAFGEKMPRSSLDRANAIYKLLLKKEPYDEQTFLHRIYFTQPMKALNWTPQLLKKRRQLQGKGKRLVLIVSALAILTAAIGSGVYLTL